MTVKPHKTVKHIGELLKIKEASDVVKGLYSSKLSEPIKNTTKTRKLSKLDKIDRFRVYLNGRNN